MKTMCFIRYSVGPGQRNEASDVRVVQELLSMGGSGFSPFASAPAITGMFDTSTGSALQGFIQSLSPKGLVGFLQLSPVNRLGGLQPADAVYRSLCADAFSSNCLQPLSRTDRILLERACSFGPDALSFTSFRTIINLRKLVPVSPQMPLQELVKLPEIRAMLDTIAWAEGNNDYNTVVHGKDVASGLPSKPVTDLSHHPNLLVEWAKGSYSTAAGRYQFLKSTWDNLQKSFHLPDFQPASQDLACLELMRQKKMIEPLLKGNVEEALRRGNTTWASLPGASYSGQHAQSMTKAVAMYRQNLQTYKGQHP